MFRLNIILSIIAGVAFTGVLLGISNATGGVDLLGEFMAGLKTR